MHVSWRVLQLASLTRSLNLLLTQNAVHELSFGRDFAKFLSSVLLMKRGNCYCHMGNSEPKRDGTHPKTSHGVSSGLNYYNVRS